MKSYLATLALAITCATACSSSSSPAQTVQPLDPKVAHFGKTLDEWAGAWVKWVYEWPIKADCSNPMEDATGDLCTLYQDESSPVFFVAGNWGGVSKRDKCKLPAGKPLLVPVLVGFQDNGGVPPESVKADDELKHGSELQSDAMSGLDFSLDGQSIVPLAPFAVRAARYEYTLPPEPNIYTCQGAPGVTGTFAGYTSGTFVLLPALPSGPHRIAMKGEIHLSGDAPFSLDVTFDPITIP